MEINLGKVKIDDKTNILDINVPKEMEHNVETGHWAADTLYAGDGVTPSTVSLVTGMPGAGKSTLMIELADAVTGEGNIALYNTGEESLYQIRRVTSRLNLTNGFYVGHNRSVTDVIAHVVQLQKDNPDKQVFLFQDSLQTLEVPREPGQVGRPLSGARAQLTSLEMVTGWAKQTYGIAFIVGQVNKKGDFAGKNEIKHVVDCHLHLGYVLDMNTGQEVNCAEMQKNRFGPGGKYFYFDLNARGCVFRDTRRVAVEV